MQAAKHRILDTFGAIVSGAQLKPGEMAIRYVQTLGGTSEASVPATLVRTSAINAALAAGMFAHDFGSATNYDLGFEWQSPKQLGTQVRLTDPVSNHEGPGRTDIDNVAVLQLFRNNAWLKGPVASDVHAPQKNDLRH